ncbi:sulfur carrier protein ThiS adenylyltransferase [Desulfomicrobium apsheronum]|uniref:Sulfur carrier protein ThiS adenylyltransferase n=1 Tax=Desulfomicrobium apsheronum TaxID=52560 RepID=A0A1I3Z7A8_9BACT|nr:sulfur carrier protein ThiS adenylyltransferase ThiF [Desulfomicrobium apsheronum]SFK39466.1 sulfur carrier protein ThiS adenylyltransferase [Desulfomicrobium apsheronum]
MNTFEHGLTRYLGEGFLSFLRSVRIGIIGAGGLGSNCAVHLVRCGFTNLVLADADEVEPSNLNRQHFTLAQVGRPKVEALRDNLTAINPAARIEALHLHVNARNMASLFASSDAVVEAVDDPRTKKLIVEIMTQAGRLVVGASGLGGFGRAGSMTVRTVRPGLVIVGDHVTPCDIPNPPMSPCVGMAAAMQADVILNHFHTIYKEKA